MKNKKYPGTTHYRDRHGKLRWRFRRPGLKDSQTTALYESPEWLTWYFAAEAGETTPARMIGAERTKPGSMGALIAAYYNSAAFKNDLAPSTQTTYRGILERFRAKHGEKPVAALERRHIAQILDGMADTPSAANNLLRLLHLLMSFAIERDWRRDDPTYGVKKLKQRVGGFHTWTEEEIATFEAKYPVGSRERLAMALLLYTGQRRSDVVRMGRQHVRGVKITVTTQKSQGRTVLEIPMHSRLREAIDACPNNHLTFLVTKDGRPFSAAGFGNYMREVCDAAGLPDCSSHGLRKAACRRLAEASATPHQIMAITGHKSLKDVTTYTSAANQSRLAEDAVDALGGDGWRTNAG